MKIGIMQSRLSPIDLAKGYQYFPANWWQEEFVLAQQYGFSHIEWIYDGWTDNIIDEPLGYQSVNKWALKTNVMVDTICGDCFIKYPLWEPSMTHCSIRMLNRLITDAYTLGARNIVIPCLDRSTFPDSDAIAAFVDIIKVCLDTAGRYVVNLCIETNLQPSAVADLIARVNSPRFGFCYDTGNAVAAGYTIEEIIQTCGPAIKHVHLKDCKYKTGNIKVGYGDVNFPEVFKQLRSVGYDGSYTLQCARTEHYDLDFIKKQFTMMETFANGTI